MGKQLIIAEKPSVAKDIAAALGGFSRKEDGTYESSDAVITNALGHLVVIGMNKEEDRGWELPNLPSIPTKFVLQPNSEGPRGAGCKAQLNLIGKLVKRPDIDGVVNACDAGREGELIFRLIYLILGCKKPMQRMWLQSMTPDAIRAGYKSMRSSAEMESLFHAAISRAEADWLVGVNGTRALTKFREAQGKEEGVASAGRVQSPVLALVYDREMAIKTFVARDFWEVHGTFGAAAGKYDGKWFDPAFVKGDRDDAYKADRLFDQTRAKEIERKCSGVNPSSVTEESVPSKSMPPKLFDLTTLQREANTKFGFSAKATLDIAQALYETHKVLTYPRTDASALPEDYVETAKQTLDTFGGSVFAPHAKRVLDNGWVKSDKRIFDNSKISDHFAIIPNGHKPGALSADEAKIYDLVTRRFIAVFHPAAEYMKTTRISVVAGESFKSSGSVLISEGWLAVYGKEVDMEDSKSLCKVSPGEAVTTLEVKTVGLRTTPPERYTEATLLAAMESAGKLVDEDDYAEAMIRGLGTPATRAATIEELLSKGKLYLVREKRYLVPTTKAMEVIALLRTNGVEQLTSPGMTGEWEYKLAQIEAGKFTRAAFMAEAKAMTVQIVDKFRAKASTLPPVPGAEAVTLAAGCPRCKAEVRGIGKLYSCSGCDFKMWREIASRAISAQEAERLLADGRTGVLEGFVGAKSKKPFAAALVFDKDFAKVSFEFADAAPPPTGADRKVVGSCPKCSGEVVVAGEAYVCEHSSVSAAKRCDFRISGVIASRKLDAATASQLLSTGQAGPFADFISTKKRPFTAKLKLASNGKVEFEFEKK